MALKILVTGGTFDKEYDEITGKLYFKETHMKEILRLGRSQANVRVKKLMLMDSLDMKSSDREIILKNCKKCKRKTNCCYSRNRYDDKNSQGHR